MKNPLNSGLMRYRLSLQLRVKHLLHRNEEGIQINMENTACHETVYKLAHRVDKANFLSKCAPTILTIVQFGPVEQFVLE